MSLRTLKNLLTRQNQGQIVAGSFAPAGGGAPTTIKGVGFSVARTGVGTFVVTLDDPCNDVIAATASLQLGAEAGNDSQIGPINVPAGQNSRATITIYTFTTSTGALVDIAANANNRVNFDLLIKTGGAKP